MRTRHKRPEAALELLTDRVASPTGIAGELEAALGDVAYHTRALDRYGALELVDTAQRRGATEHFYKAHPGAFVGGPSWRKVPRAIRGGVSAATLQTFLDKAIAALEAGTLDGRDDTVFRWMPLHLEDRLSEGENEDTASTVVGMAAFETAGSIEAA